MADGLAKKKSSRIKDPPVCSTDYKKVLKTVREKRKEIESKETELNSLKAAFEELKLSHGSQLPLPEAELPELLELEEQEVELPVEQGPQRLHADGGEHQAIDFGADGSKIREKIVTPGGTKRKVRPMHRQLCFAMKDALGDLVEEMPGNVLLVDDLLASLLIKHPHLKGIEQSRVLTLVSGVLGKAQRQGKKKVRYYRNIALKKGTNPDQEAELVKSPQRKARRGLLQMSTVPQSHFQGRSILQLPLKDDDSVGIDNTIHGCAPKAMNVWQDVQQSFTDQAGLDVDTAAIFKKLEEIQKIQEEYATQIISKQEEVIQLYKEILDSGNLLGGLLSLSEKSTIREEVKKTKSLFNLKIRGCDGVQDLMNNFEPGLFQNLVEDMRTECPTITNIIEQLVLSSNTRRNTLNTTQRKLKAGIHLLASLMDVRDQRGHNDIPVLFGLLCICHGAGPSLIHILQHLGLSESFPVLIGILKSQLQHYKELIKKRVKVDVPVLTYQDNMQMKRTSLRHLRLSKLQKEKMKQGKMWDFTVRGYREAEVQGVEHLFADPVKASKPQRDIVGLKYQDLRIECNQEQFERWQNFKEREMLRKLHLGLNAVTLSCEEIAGSTDEELKTSTSSETKGGSYMYKIEIPPVDEDFPLLSKVKSRIYPLPISHENQCTNIGTASNLDLFTSEFGFESETKNNYLPLSRSGKDFDLERAYQRFAFMKMLEKHKERQRQYEQFLRGVANVDILAEDDEQEEADEESDDD